MKNDLKTMNTQHPCVNWCPQYVGEPCGHCMIDIIRLNKYSIDEMGDDEHIENHVSPLCVVGGDA